MGSFFRLHPGKLGIASFMLALSGSIWAYGLFLIFVFLVDPVHSVSAPLLIIIALMPVALAAILAGLSIILWIQRSDGSRFPAWAVLGLVVSLAEMLFVMTAH